MKEKRQLYVGDFVKLNMEYAPTMRIEKILGRRVFCLWFDKSHRPHEKTFMIEEVFLVAKK